MLGSHPAHVENWQVCSLIGAVLEIMGTGQLAWIHFLVRRAAA